MTTNLKCEDLGWRLSSDLKLFYDLSIVLISFIQLTQLESPRERDVLLGRCLHQHALGQVGCPQLYKKADRATHEEQAS